MAKPPFHPFRSERAKEEFYRTYALDLVNDVGLSTPRCELRTPDDLVRWRSVLRFSLSFHIRVALLFLPLPGRREGRGVGGLRRIVRWIFQDALRSSGAARAAVEQDIFDMVMSGRFLAQPWMMWSTVLTDQEWKWFRVPALFLVGEHEKIYSAAGAVKRLNRVAPQVRTEIIPGAGHDLTMVKADLVAERILAFLGESVPGDQPTAVGADVASI